MIKKNFILLIYILISSLLLSQEPHYSFIKEIEKETPNLFVADSLYKIEVSKITGEPINPYKSFTAHRNLGLAFNDYYRWRKQNAYYADQYGYIRKGDRPLVKNSSSRKATLSNTSNLQAVTASTGNIVDWKVQTSNIWNFIGPYETNSRMAENKIVNRQSCVVTMDRSRSNPDVLVCGIQYNTVWKSTDKGNNWVAITNNLDIGTDVQVVKIHPENENFIAFVTNNRIYITQDGGINWTDTNIPTNGLTASSDFNVYATTGLEIIPNTIQGEKPLILITGRRGVWEYDLDTNTVSTYSKLLVPSSDIKMHPTNYNIIYILAFDDTDNRQIIYKSEDRGNTWTNKDGNGWLTVPSGYTELVNSAGGRIGLSETNENLIYAYIIGNYTSNEDYGLTGLYRSNDGGNTWSLTDPLGPGKGSTGYNRDVSGGTHINVAASYGSGAHQGFWNVALTINPDNDDEVLLGGVETYRTEDGGISWIRLSGASNFEVHSDIQAATSMVVNGVAETFVSNDGGIIFSNDFFRTPFEVKSYALPSEFWGLDVGIYHPTITGGRNHNGDVAYHSTLPQYTWKAMGGSESSTGLVYLAYDERAVHYTDTSDGIIPLTLDGEKDSSIPQLTPKIRQDQSTPAYGAKKTLSGVFYYFNKENERELYKIINVGESLLLHSFSADTYSMEPCATNENYIYVTLKNGTNNSDPSNILQRTTDGGLTWNTIYTFSESLNFRLQVDNKDPNHIWAYGQNSSIIYESKDGGTTFTQLATPPGVISELLYQWSSNNMYAFKTNSNLLYRYEIDNDTWYDYSSGLPASSLPMTMKIMYSEDKLILANKAMGLWMADLYSKSTSIEPFVQITSDKTFVIEKTDVFTFDSEIYSAFTPSYEWTTNTTNAVIATPTAKTTQIIFNEYGIFDAILNIYDGSTLISSITKKVYVYPGCSFDNQQNNILIPLKNIEFWLKGDDLIKQETGQAFDNFVTDFYSNDHGIANACVAPLQIENYNSTIYKALQLSGNSYCRINLDKEYTNGKTFFFVGHQDSDALTTSRPYFGHDVDNHFTNNSANILNTTSKPNFDLVKLNGADITSSVNLVDRPTSPALTIFRAKDGMQINFQTISRNRTSNSQVWKGPIAEIIVYNYRLTDAEIEKVENYLMTKYNITP